MRHPQGGCSQLKCEPQSPSSLSQSSLAPSTPQARQTSQRYPKSQSSQAEGCRECSKDKTSGARFPEGRKLARVSPRAEGLYWDPHLVPEPGLDPGRGKGKNSPSHCSRHARSLEAESARVRAWVLAGGRSLRPGDVQLQPLSALSGPESVHLVFSSLALPV
jgi:hypothetical protein